MNSEQKHILYTTVYLNGVCVNNIRYADDTVLIADSESGLQTLFDVLTLASQEYGMTINAKKTKSMVISKESQAPTCTLLHGEETIKQVEAFNYLGSYITSDGRCKTEIKRRIRRAK